MKISIKTRIWEKDLDSIRKFTADVNFANFIVNMMCTGIIAYYGGRWVLILPVFGLFMNLLLYISYNKYMEQKRKREGLGGE